MTSPDPKMFPSGEVRTPADGFSLRQRERRDSDALVAMFNQPRCRLGMVLEPFSSTLDLEAWLESNGAGNFEPVATVDDEAIGLAGLFPCRGTQSHAAWISLFVHDAFHGRGVGTLLMTALIATAHLLELSRIQLIVFCDNEGAISLYRKFGFEIEGRHERYARRNDGFAAAFTMSRIAARGTVRHRKIGQLCHDLSTLRAAKAADYQKLFASARVAGL
jgi:putative acetyltransferase